MPRAGPASEAHTEPPPPPPPSTHTTRERLDPALLDAMRAANRRVLLPVCRGGGLDKAAYKRLARRLVAEAPRHVTRDGWSPEQYAWLAASASLPPALAARVPPPAPLAESNAARRAAHQRAVQLCGARAPREVRRAASAALARWLLCGERTEASAASDAATQQEERAARLALHFAKHAVARP